MVPLRSIAMALLLFTAAALCPREATAGPLYFEDGRWKIEVAGYGTVSASDRSHRDEFYGTLALEYEVPMFQRATMGLRAMPLFLYDEGGDAGLIYGVGGGLAFRYYLRGETRSGPFAEVGSTLMWHHKEFTDSDGRLDFLSFAGLGYRWDAGVQVSLRYEHISNGGLFKENVNINAVGLAIGYTF